MSRNREAAVVQDVRLLGTMFPRKGRISASCRLHRGVPLGWHSRTGRKFPDVLNGGHYTLSAILIPLRT